MEKKNDGENPSDVKGSDLETGESKECAHTYLGMVLEDNKEWLKALKEESVRCGGCNETIEEAFYRCATCQFEYVWCKSCYQQSAGTKLKRVSKKKKIE